jgi:hypothetical protein
MPDWLIPVLTFLTGGLGGYLGASGKVIRLEMEVKELISWRRKAQRKLDLYGEDLLIYDIELENIHVKLDMQRAKRQRLREEEE